MRVLLLVLLTGLAGCATIAPVTVGRSSVPADGVALALTSGAARSTNGQTVQKRGLPLTRGQKIALWTGVAVLTGYLMTESANEEDSAFGGY
jgi:succinate dehydrogenase/fumarate reductase flavoprotein subunit